MRPWTSTHPWLISSRTEADLNSGRSKHQYSTTTWPPRHSGFTWEAEKRSPPGA